jgi:hypothetical protein
LKSTLHFYQPQESFMDFSAAAAYNPNKEQPRPYVQFEMRAVEDRSAPTTDGVTRMVDKAWAIVRAPGSKDAIEKLATEWLDQLKAYARDGRIPSQWPGEYRNAFEMWSKGEELPVQGTAIKTWPPLSPAQRKNVLAAGILTVEDLANANDEIRAAIGMGGNTLQQMAQKWLEEAKDKGATAKALEAAMVKLAEMEALVKSQTEALAELKAQAKPK